MKAQRDEEELRHIERLEWGEQEVEGPNMEKNAAACRSTQLADLAAQVKNQTEIIENLVRKKKKPTKRKRVTPNEASDFLQTPCHIRTATPTSDTSCSTYEVFTNSLLLCTPQQSSYHFL